MDKKEADEIRELLGINTFRHTGKGLAIVLETRNCGISHLKRQIKKRHGIELTLCAAGNILDNLEKLGVISRFEDCPVRKVLWSSSLEE